MRPTLENYAIKFIIIIINIIQRFKLCIISQSLDTHLKLLTCQRRVPQLNANIDLCLDLFFFYINK